MNDAPVLVMIAGPNGSGKSSTIIKQVFNTKFNPPSLYINADDIVVDMITKQKIDKNTLSDKELWDLNLKAANKAEQLRQDAIKNKQSFIMETVMSTHGRVDLLRQAKENGFDTHLLFVTTQDTDINKERVKDRVEKGGHDVPLDKIESRYQKAMKLLPEAIHEATTARVFNNSFEFPVMILQKSRDNEIILYPQNPPNGHSKWTFDKLKIIKDEVVKLDRLDEILKAPDVKDLHHNADTKSLYNAYAKEVLQQSGNVWTEKTNELIASKLILAGMPSTKIKNILYHSPDPIEHPYEFIRRIAREPEIKATILKSNGLEL